MDGRLKQQVCEVFHYRWKDYKEARGFHLPSKHPEGEASCNMCNSKLKEFSELSGAEQDELRLLMELFEQAILSCSLSIDVPQNLAPRDQLTFSKLPQLKELMMNFVKQRVKHPKGVGDVFPYEELSRLILLKFAAEETNEPKV